MRRVARLRALVSCLKAKLLQDYRKMSEIVFLVGAGRSGTTLLYKLLALHPGIRVITNYDVHFGHWSPAGLIMRLTGRFPSIRKSLWF